MKQTNIINVQLRILEIHNKIKELLYELKDITMILTEDIKEGETK